MTNRQSLSFKKQQFQEFDFFAGTNNNSQEKSNFHEEKHDSHNMQQYDDDVLGDDSNIDTPKRRKEQENINLKFAAVVSDGIK